MKIIIRVETIADWGETETVELCQFERPIGELAPENVGLSLADDKELLHKLHQVVIGAQSEEICAFRRFCTRCGRRLFLKDYRKRKVDTSPFVVLESCRAFANHHAIWKLRTARWVHIFQSV